MRSLFYILCVAMVSSGCKSTADFAAGQPSACEIHNTEMSVQRVKLTFGMRLPAPEDEARPALFPHADAPYDTGYCAPLRQDYARVFVCPRCTEVRAFWLSTNTVAGE